MPRPSIIPSVRAKLEQDLEDIESECQRQPGLSAPTEH